VPNSTGFDAVRTRARREVGSTVYQVFDGDGRFELANNAFDVTRGDLVVVPSWTEWSLEADTDLDLFAFSEAPIVERLNFHRSQVTEGA
jgi:gentisate 1,2-dioxygenase